MRPSFSEENDQIHPQMFADRQSNVDLRKCVETGGQLDMPHLGPLFISFWASIWSRLYSYIVGRCQTLVRPLTLEVAFKLWLSGEVAV